MEHRETSFPRWTVQSLSSSLSYFLLGTHGTETTLALPRFDLSWDLGTEPTVAPGGAEEAILDGTRWERGSRGWPNLCSPDNSIFIARSVQIAGLFQSSFCHKGPFQHPRHYSLWLSCSSRTAVQQGGPGVTLCSSQDSPDRIGATTVTYDVLGQG